MPSRSHTAEIVLPATPYRVFRLLITPSAIRSWWQAARAIVVAEAGGIWVATWGDSEDDPDYITAATIREFDPPRRLVLADYRYRAKSGPLPFQANFVTTFAVEPHDQGCLLRVTQDGFPGDKAADDFYAACEKGWSDTLNNIRKFVGPT